MRLIISVGRARKAVTATTRERRESSGKQHVPERKRKSEEEKSAQIRKQKKEVNKIRKVSSGEKKVKKCITYQTSREESKSKKVEK